MSDLTQRARNTQSLTTEQEMQLCRQLADALEAAEARKVLRDRAHELAEARISELERQLAECFRLSGADPDGNEDWRLAKSAVDEVKRLRTEFDANETRIVELERQLSDAQEEFVSLHETITQQHAAALKLNRQLSDVQELDWMDEARQSAAQCWCDPETSHIEMNVALAESVAHRIAAWIQDAARYCQNADYWRNRANAVEAELAAIRALPINESAQRTPAQQMPTMATRGAGIAGVDSPILTGLEPATSVKIPVADSAVAGAHQESVAPAPVVTAEPSSEDSGAQAAADHSATGNMVDDHRDALLKAAIYVRDDLLLRAKIGTFDGDHEVQIGNGAWMQLNEAIDAMRAEKPAA